MDSLERIRIGKLFAKKHRAGFNSRAEFVGWWIEQQKEQEGCCFYCETSIDLIRKLIQQNQLRRRKVGWGFRGPTFELDRKDSGNPYEPQNCVLACYYCNNDKSNIYDWREYKASFGPNRKRHFERLEALRKLEPSE